MKYLPLLLLIFLSACASPNGNPKDSLVTILDRDGYALGRGVLLDESTLMTAAHVYALCERKSCLYEDISGNRSPLLENLSRDPSRDIARVKISPQASNIGIDISSQPVIGDSLYALVNRSRKIIRIDGKILSLDASYLAYDESLSGKVYTGAIETDIVLEAGESGTPIWTHSGELLGIMSAVDREGNRGWVVR